MLNIQHEEFFFFFFNLPDVLTLPEFNNSLPDLLCSDDDSGNEDALEMEYSEAEAEELKRNAEVYVHQLQTPNSPPASTKQMIICDDKWMTQSFCCRVESLPTPSGSSASSVTSAPAHHRVWATCAQFGYHSSVSLFSILY